MSHDDHHEHGPGCCHDEEQDIVVLLDEDENEHRFCVIDIVEVDGHSYAVLAPEEADDEEEGEAYIFRIESENGEDQLITVDDEEEFERVAAALAELDEGWEEQDDLSTDDEDD